MTIACYIAMVLYRYYYYRGMLQCSYQHVGTQGSLAATSLFAIHMCILHSQLFFHAVTYLII